jgi:hypothetical protein
MSIEAKDKAVERAQQGWWKTWPAEDVLLLHIKFTADRLLAYKDSLTQPWPDMHPWCWRLFQNLPLHDVKDAENNLLLSLGNAIYAQGQEKLEVSKP